MVATAASRSPRFAWPGSRHVSVRVPGPPAVTERVPTTRRPRRRTKFSVAVPAGTVRGTLTRARAVRARPWRAIVSAVTFAPFPRLAAAA